MSKEQCRYNGELTRLCIPIPSEIAEQFGVSAGDAADIVWENGRFVVRRLDKPLDEIDAMILTITPENRHPEISTGPPRGNEVW